MIRGGFRGFTSGWPGVIMIVIALLSILTCICCWCASLFYGRSTHRRRRESDHSLTDQTRSLAQIQLKENSGAQNLELEPLGGIVIGSENSWVPPSEPPAPGTCPYPVDPALDGMPRPPGESFKY